MIIFALALVGLVVSGGVVASSLRSLARAGRASVFTASFLVLALATSLPELMIGLDSAWRGLPELSLGNVVGTIPANLGLAMGLLAVLSGGIKLQHRSILRQISLTAIIIISPIGLMADGQISRFDGALLIALFIWYFSWLVKSRTQFIQQLHSSGPVFKGCLSNIVRFIVSVIVLLVSAYLVVYQAGQVALGLGVSELALGLVVLGLGTSLPELVLSIKSGLERSPTLALGDLLGASAINTSAILGATALIAPIESIAIFQIEPSVVISLMMLALVVIGLNSRKGLTRSNGLVLIVLFIVQALLAYLSAF